jgi:hypothetical protein
MNCFDECLLILCVIFVMICYILCFALGLFLSCVWLMILFRFFSFIKGFFFFLAFEWMCVIVFLFVYFLVVE